MIIDNHVLHKIPTKKKKMKKKTKTNWTNKRPISQTKFHRPTIIAVSSATMTNAAIFRPTCIIQRTSPRRQTVDNRLSWFIRTSRIGAYIPHVTINRVTINNLGATYIYIHIYTYTIVQLSRLNLARHRVPIIYKRQWRRFPYINWRGAPVGGGGEGRVPCSIE